MGIIDEIRDTVLGWIDSAVSRVYSVIYRYYNYATSYASQLYDILRDEIGYYYERAKDYSETLLVDVWGEFNKVWERIGAIPVITVEVVRGWVMPWIQKASDALHELFDMDIMRIWDWIDDFLPDFTEVQDWFFNRFTWFDEQLDNAKERVIRWVEEHAEDILDRLFE